MDFSDAVIFVAAVIAIVAAGALLGFALSRRNRKQHNPEKVNLYGALIASLDGLRTADDDTKREFVELYYDVLMHGSDNVVRALNSFLQLATAPDNRFDASTMAAARDMVVLAMRRDARGEYGLDTSLQTQELYSVEIGGVDRSAMQDQEASSAPTPAEHLQPAAPVETRMKPESIVDAPHPEPTPVPQGPIHPADDVYQR